MRKLFIQIDSNINPLKEERFDDELPLQVLLEKYPELIPSEEIIGNPSFFLIQREFPVSVGYLDHLFIDQMMVPTIVETKVNNSEIRRKIIGQGYEYLTSLFFEITGKQIIESAKRYWKDKYDYEVSKRLDLKELNEKELDKNLKKPRLRLIFAADFIPRELRKFVEFINVASRGIDVYAVQVEQFPLDDKKIISISTWGPTESVVHDKSVSLGILSEEEFIAKINQSQAFSPTEKDTFIQRIKQMLDVAEENNLSIRWGTTSLMISYVQNKEHKKLLEIDYKGPSYGYFIPNEQRDEFIIDIYERLNDIFNFQKKYLDPKAQFKMGVRKLFQLSQDEFQYLIEILISLGQNRN